MKTKNMTLHKMFIKRSFSSHFFVCLLNAFFYSSRTFLHHLKFERIILRLLCVYDLSLEVCNLKYCYLIIPLWHSYCVSLLYVLLNVKGGNLWTCFCEPLYWLTIINNHCLSTWILSMSHFFYVFTRKFNLILNL